MAQPTITILDGNSASKSMGTMTDAAGINNYSVTTDSSIARYRACASFIPATASALTVAALKGSASKTIRVQRVWLSGYADAIASTMFKLIRVSALGAGGTVVTPTVAKLDTGAAAATAVGEVYTTTVKAADTTAEGPLHVWLQFIATVTTPATAYIEQQAIFPPKGASSGQSIVLRGTSQILAVTNFNGGNLGANTVLQVGFEWTEDDS